jgi:acetyltransferase-like isoleucine patch superfamily enzyme
MFGKLIYFLYRFSFASFRTWLRKLAFRLEGGEFYSKTLRHIFRNFYGVEIGMYTHGACFIPFEFDPHTTVGRYSSIARGARVLNINHPMDLKSTHGFFFNPLLKLCGKGSMNYIPLSIGNDVWIGANALILPHTKRIGDGAVIAAGAVVNKDVPPYAVVVGNPARVVRFRFSKEVIEQLLASRWWDKSVEELDMNEFTKPFLTNLTTDNMEQNVLSEI